MLGRDSSEQEKVKGAEAAQEYLDSDPSERDSSTAVYKVQQGQEPLSFTGFFQVKNFLVVFIFEISSSDNFMFS